MKQWKQLVAGLLCALAVSLPAQAALFSITDGIAGEGLQIRTYVFDISVPANYLASLADLAFPDAFDSLSLGVVETGGSTLLGSITGTDSFEFTALNSGSYSLLLVGDPGASNAGFYSINVAATPEPATWLIMGLGALLVGFVRLRASV